MSSVLNTVLSTRLSNFKSNNHRVRTRPVLSPASVSFSRRRLTVRAQEPNANEVKPQAPDKAPAASGSSFNQILGIKGASQETNKWKIRLQLTKPVTWPPLVWGVVCGAAASGNFHWNLEDVAKSIVCMIMSGPCLTGYTQTLNDWYDREIDAINEPYRPIPSGAISENEVITQIWVLLLAGLGLSGLLDVWAGHNFPTVFYLAFIADSEVPGELEPRKIFLQGLSKDGFPVLVAQVRKHFPSKDPLQFKKFVVHLLDKTFASSFRGSEIGNEKLIVILDLQQISYKNIDVRGMITGFQCLQAYYPERLAKLYFLHMPGFFVSVWRMVSRFLEKATLEKVFIVTNEEEMKDFVKEIGEEVLPEEYGGRAKLVAFQDIALPPLDYASS